MDDDRNILLLDRSRVCAACGRLLASRSGRQHEREGQDVVGDYYANLLREVKAEQARGVPELSDGD